MAKLFGELLFGFIRILVADVLKQAGIKFCTWLDTKIHNRIAKVVVGGLLGLAALFVFPIIMGLFS